jgi:hypothetical protein
MFVHTGVLYAKWKNRKGRCNHLTNFHQSSSYLRYHSISVHPIRDKSSTYLEQRRHMLATPFSSHEYWFIQFNKFIVEVRKQLVMQTSNETGPMAAHSQWNSMPAPYLTRYTSSTKDGERKSSTSLWFFTQNCPWIFTIDTTRFT